MVLLICGSIGRPAPAWIASFFYDHPSELASIGDNENMPQSVIFLLLIIRWWLFFWYLIVDEKGLNKAEEEGPLGLPFIFCQKNFLCTFLYWKFRLKSMERLGFSFLLLFSRTAIWLIRKSAFLQRWFLPRAHDWNN